MSDDDILSYLNSQDKKQEKKTDKKSSKKAKEQPASAPLQLLLGLEFGDQIDPPTGYGAAYSLHGTLSFCGGRKHDQAFGNIALALKDNNWEYIGRSGISGVTSNQEIELWLDYMKSRVK